MRLPVSFLPFAILAAAHCAAAPKLDLERIVPVPADQPIPTQDFFRPALLSEPELNRAGTHIAAIVTAGEDKHQLFVHDIAKDKFEVLGDGTSREFYNVSWLDSTRVIFHVSSQKAYGLGLLAADVGNLRMAYPMQQYTGASLVSVPLKNERQPLVWNRSDFETGNDEGVVVLNSNIQTGYMADLTGATANGDSLASVRDNNFKRIIRYLPKPTGPAVTYRYMADKTGELAYCFRSLNGNLSLLRLDGTKWVPVSVDLEEVDVIGNANEPGQLLVVAHTNDGKPSPLRFLDVVTGKLGDVVLDDANYDFNGWLYHNRATGDVLGAIFHKSGPRVVWFNDQYRALQKVLDGMFPKQVVRILGNDDTHAMFLVATFSDTHPVSYHWVNLGTRQAGLFKQSAPWIDPQRMQPMKILSFKTRDGYKLDSYLTLPAGASKENPPPLVVLCHGGPWVRDQWGYDGQVQFFAHHGYAVLQPNYRGSTGSVGRFPDDDEYDFVKMHNDVTDAVKAVAASGLVAKDRIAIMGGSFGGYLAVSGVAHEPELYRCAVTNAGVFDWALQVKAEKRGQYDLPFYGRMIKKLGDPAKEPSKYEAMSPIKHVANIRVPVFVAGGKDDQVVELQQSRKLINEFDRHNISYEKLFVGDEGHGMAFLKNEVELHDRVLAFLDKNMKAAN